MKIDKLKAKRLSRKPDQAGDAYSVKRCLASRSDGEKCRAPASTTGLCYFHEPMYEEHRRESSRKGGNRRTVELPKLPALTAEQTRELMASVTSAVITGSLDATTARTVGYLVSVDRQVRDSEALEARIAQLESQIAELTGSHGLAMGNGRTQVLKRVGERLERV